MFNTITANWPAPNNIKALTTTRQGGVSEYPYDTLNLGSHVGDKLDNVIANRARLIDELQIPSEPFWLNQTHSTTVISTTVIDIISQQSIDADASYTAQRNKVSVVLTADCLPVLLCSVQGDEVAAAHAGWRGLSDGILENTINAFHCPTSHIMAWLGPAIGPTKFEVGEEVKAKFEAYDRNASQAFTLTNFREQKYLANLYLLANQRLKKLGIKHIYGGEFCTYTQSDLFYSYRREKQTGRMASLIWFE